MEEDYYYHVADHPFIESILKEGLIPQIGGMSLMVEEKEKAVFLWNTKEDAEKWVSDMYGVDEPGYPPSCAMFRIHKDCVHVSNHRPQVTGQVEILVTHRIPPKCIEVEKVY